MSQQDQRDFEDGSADRGENLWRSFSRRTLLRSAGAAGVATSLAALGSQVYADNAKPSNKHLKLTWNANVICTVAVPAALERGTFANHNLEVELVNFGGSTDQLLEALAPPGAAASGVAKHEEQIGGNPTGLLSGDHGHGLTLGDVLLLLHEDGADHTRAWRGHGNLHLHRFDQNERVTLGHVVTDADLDLPYHTTKVGPYSDFGHCRSGLA
jgi:hypothetical protein